MIGQIRARKCNKMPSNSKARGADFALGPRISIPANGHDRARLKARYKNAPDHETKRFKTILRERGHPYTWHLDKVFVKVNGKLCYLWRAVDHEGEVLE